MKRQPTQKMSARRWLTPVLLGALVAPLTACMDDEDQTNSNTVAFSAPQSDCFWVGPYVKENDGFNFAYPDSGAIYWSAAYRLPEDGSYITLEADFPYSRYISYNSYRANTTPAQALTDRDISPENGSVNPFVGGNARNGEQRRYEISVRSRMPPADPATGPTNTLFDATAAAGDEAVLLYRNYVPNEGADITGDVGLPRVTLHLADGSTVQGDEACGALSAGSEPLSIPLVPADTYEFHRNNFEPARDTPAFRATYGIPFLLQCDYRGDCSDNPERDTAFYANADNQYLYSFLNREIGEVAVIRMRIPEIPKTQEGQDFFSDSGELRYWSMCQNEFYSQAVKECLYDEQVTANPDGFVTIVTSKPEDRPGNANEDCGVGFLPWPDNGDGFSFVEGRTDDLNSSFLIMRNMLPADDFDEAVQNTQTAGDEAEVLGEFLPRARYMSRSEFEGLGCDAYLSLPYNNL